MQQVSSLSVLQDGHCLFVETHTELILCMFTRLCTKFSMPCLLVVVSNRKRKMRPTEFVRSSCWGHHIAFTPFKKDSFYEICAFFRYRQQISESCTKWWYFCFHLWHSHSFRVGTDVQNLKIGSQIQITYNEMMSTLGVMNILRGTDPRTWW